MAYFQDGSGFVEATRPVPRTLRFRIQLETAIVRLIRFARPQLIPSESTYALPPGSLRHCLS